MTTKSSTSAKMYRKVRNIIYYLLGIIEAILALRFIFKIMGANPGNRIVEFLYNVTGIFVQPFQGIFNRAVTEGAQIQTVFEPSTLIAMFVYYLVVAALLKLIEIILFNKSTI